MNPTILFGLSALFFAALIVQEVLKERSERRDLELLLRREQQALLEATEARERAERVMHATHHELNRTITMVGFAVDDLVVDVPTADLHELLDSYSKLEDGRDNVAAMAQLGARDGVTVFSPVRSADLEVESETVVVTVGGSGTVKGDSLLLRTLVRKAVRLAELYGGASALSVTVNDGLLVLVDDGRGMAQADIEDAWENADRSDGAIGDGIQIIREIVVAHGASVDVTSAVGEGVRLEIDLRSTDVALGDQTAHSRLRDLHIGV